MPPRVLIVEDELLIALDLEQTRSCSTIASISRGPANGPSDLVHSRDTHGQATGISGPRSAAFGSKVHGLFGKACRPSRHAAGTGRMNSVVGRPSPSCG